MVRPGDGRVDLSEVEATVLRLAREFSAEVWYDRMQAEQLTQNLVRAGVRVKEFVFSTAGANRIARRLAAVLAQGRLGIPDEEETIREFQAVRLVSTGPGTVKLTNPARSHDDVVTAIGIAVAVLSERPQFDGTSITVPRVSVGSAVNVRGRSTATDVLRAQASTMVRYGTSPTGGIAGPGQVRVVRRG